MKAAFVFVPDRCTGCEACRIACGIENNHGLDTGWRSVFTYNAVRHPALPTRHLSLACNHCETPACALGCPAAAFDRDKATGAVILDPAKCIGCRYCSWLCPYDAPRFDSTRGVMTKCTFCAPRLADGGQPACTAACPTSALSFGSGDGYEPEPSYHGLGSFGLGPALRIEKPRHSAPPPALAIDELVLDSPNPPALRRKITLASEWALLLFTIVMPALVGWLGGGIVRSDRKPPLAVFIVVGLMAIALSTSHLGRPLRAWRAILNIRSSWLSREILFTNLFLASGVFMLAVPHAPTGLGVAALLSGLGLVVSIDGVYRAIPRTGRKAIDSADAAIAAVFLFGIAASSAPVAIVAAVLKGTLYVSRFVRGETGVPRPAAAARLIALTVACLPIVRWDLAFALAIIGEVVDRAGFYNALDPTTPVSRMAEEMRTELRRAAGLGAGRRWPSGTAVPSSRDDEVRSANS